MEALQIKEIKISYSIFEIVGGWAYPIHSEKGFYHFRCSITHCSSYLCIQMRQKLEEVVIIIIMHCSIAKIDLTNCTVM